MQVNLIHVLPHVPVWFYFYDMWHWLTAYVEADENAIDIGSGLCQGGCKCQGHKCKLIPREIVGAFENRMNMYMALGVDINESISSGIGFKKTLLHALLYGDSIAEAEQSIKNLKEEGYVGNFEDPFEHPMVPVYILAYLKKNNVNATIETLRQVEEKNGEQNFRLFSEMRGKILYYSPKK